MKRYPYYRRYPTDFFNACIGMTFEQRAVYSMLLDLIYAHDDMLTEDDRFIAGVMGLSVKRWNARKNELILFGKITRIDGFLRNARATNEAIIRRKLSDKNRVAALTRHRVKVV